MDVELIINGEEKTASIPPETTLLKLLREEFYLTGAKTGCDVGDCGACTVLVDGEAVNSCLMLAGQVQGRSVETIEGLANLEDFHPLQKNFEDIGSLQFGICGPGMILSAKQLLEENTKPTKQEIQDAIAGNLCRCTGYTKIVEAVADAAKEMREEPLNIMGEAKDVRLSES